MTNIFLSRHCCPLQWAFSLSFSLSFLYSLFLTLSLAFKPFYINQHSKLFVLFHFRYSYSSTFIPYLLSVIETYSTAWRDLRYWNFTYYFNSSFITSDVDVIAMILTVNYTSSVERVVQYVTPYRTSTRCSIKWATLSSQASFCE